MDMGLGVAFIPLPIKDILCKAINVERYKLIFFNNIVLDFKYSKLISFCNYIQYLFKYCGTCKGCYCLL